MTSPSSRRPEPRPSDRVAALLNAAAEPGEAPVPGEQEALAAFRSARPARLRAGHPRSFAAALVASATTAVLVTGGVSAAVPGSVSEAARDTASHVLSTLGFNVAGADPSRDDRSRDEAQPSTATPTEQAVPEGTPDSVGQRDDSDVSTSTGGRGVEEDGRVAQRAITPTEGAEVADEGEALAPAAPTESTDPTDGVAEDGEVLEPTTPTDAPTESTDGTDGSVEEGEVVEPATPTESQTGTPELDTRERGRADVARSGDGDADRTAKAGGAGDTGDDGSPVGSGKSTERGHRR